MYTIIKKIDGTFHCHLRLQDETLLKDFADLADAVSWLIDGAKTQNNNTITSNDIDFLQEEAVLTTKLVRYNPDENYARRYASPRLPDSQKPEH